MGYFVTKITEVAGRQGQGQEEGPARRKKGQIFTIGGVSSKTLCTFTRQFSTLQDAGLPVLRSLRILEHQMKPGVLKNALIDVVDDVESGSTLSEAFGKHPKCFDRLYVNMVKAGEAGGALEVILKRLADFKEKAQSLKRRITGAMVYPVVVILVAVVDLDVHHDLHHPEVREDLQGLRHEAAGPDRDPDGHLATGSSTTGTSCRCSRSASGCSQADPPEQDAATTPWTGSYLWIPIVGTLIEKTIVARTMRTLGTLVAPACRFWRR